MCMNNRPPPSLPHSLTRSIGAGKSVLFALIILSIFFVSIEIILFLIGVRPVIDTKDPLVGFSGNIPLYVETSAENGSVTMTTAENKTDWFNKQSFPKIKPKNGYRIFCVGGSTTVGRPYRHNTSFCGWLEQYGALPGSHKARCLTCDYWQLKNFR